MNKFNFSNNKIFYLVAFLLIVAIWNFWVTLLSFETVHRIELRQQGLNPAAHDSILFSQRLNYPGK